MRYTIVLPSVASSRPSAFLIEESDPPPQGEGGVCYVDLLGTGSETDIYLYLKHFADED